MRENGVRKCDEERNKESKRQRKNEQEKGTIEKKRKTVKEREMRNENFLYYKNLFVSIKVGVGKHSLCMILH